MSDGLMQIGEVASRTGLSLRSIRYYEEEGLVSPSARSAGGFRLFTEADLARLGLIMRMKPLGFTLDQMRDVLVCLDAAATAEPGSPEFADVLDELDSHKKAANDRVVALRQELLVAEGFAQELRTSTSRLRRKANATH